MSSRSTRYRSVSEHENRNFPHGNFPLVQSGQGFLGVLSSHRKLSLLASTAKTRVSRSVRLQSLAEIVCNSRLQVRFLDGFCILDGAHLYKLSRFGKVRFAVGGSAFLDS